MPVTKKQSLERIEATKEKAHVFLEDIAYIRDIAKNPSPARGDIRRLSVLLRRILVNGELRDIAAPRLEKLELLAPDNTHVYELPENLELVFFCSGGGNVLGTKGMHITAFYVDPKTMFGRPTNSNEAAQKQPEPRKRVSFPLDRFLSQPVLYVGNKWASRREIIKYIANIAGAAHTGQPKKPEEIKIAKMRAYGVLRHTEGGVKVELAHRGIGNDDFSFRPEPDAIDFVLFELISAAHWVATSPPVQRLEEILRAEFDDDAKRNKE